MLTGANFSCFFAVLLTQKGFPPPCFLFWKAPGFGGASTDSRRVQVQLAEPTEGSSKLRPPLGSSCRYAGQPAANISCLKRETCPFKVAFFCFFSGSFAAAAGKPPRSAASTLQTTPTSDEIIWIGLVGAAPSEDHLCALPPHPRPGAGATRPPLVISGGRPRVPAPSKRFLGGDSSFKDAASKGLRTHKSASF